jgi:hypothetical protein
MEALRDHARGGSAMAKRHDRSSWKKLVRQLIADATAAIDLMRRFGLP